jgi:hypothetical protein
VFARRLAERVSEPTFDAVRHERENAAAIDRYIG